MSSETDATPAPPSWKVAVSANVGALGAAGLLYLWEPARPFVLWLLAAMVFFQVLEVIGRVAARIERVLLVRSAVGHPEGRQRPWLVWCWVLGASALLAFAVRLLSPSNWIWSLLPTGILFGVLIGRALRRGTHRMRRWF